MNLVPALLIAVALGREPVQLLEIRVPRHEVVYDLPKSLNVENATDSTVVILADARGRELLTRAGYPIRTLVPDYQAWLDSVLQNYLTYAEVCSVMRLIAASHPAVCRLDTIGFTVLDRPVLAMRVTDQPSVEEPEPEFRVIGAHHGDEKISTAVALEFLRFLAESYDTSSAVRDLVDSREIWVIPILNADGYVANSRSNANGVDLNRDYGYKWYGQGGSPSPFSQRESRAIRAHGLDNDIVLEYAFHSAAAYVNYLWDNHPADPPDSNLILALARQYADSTYGSATTRLTPINGYEWYAVYGSCQDANFGTLGNVAYTIETRQPSARPQIDSICVANRRALLGMLERAANGVSGTVRDSLTGLPIPARIAVTAPAGWPVYADPEVGDYHKLLPAGTYAVSAHVQGYSPKTVAGVVVPENGAVTVDFSLCPDTGATRYIEALVWLHHADPMHVIATSSYHLFGPPDGLAFSLGRLGQICLASGRTPIRDQPGNDITVFDQDTVADGYWLHAASDWGGPWSNCGHATGTADFDLAAAGLDSAGYLRIVCDSTGLNSDPCAGLDLDAVAFRTPRTETWTAPAVVRHSRVWPNPITAQTPLRLAPGTHLKIIDSAGRLVECCRVPAETDRFEFLARNLKPGVYLAIAQSPGGTAVRKLVVTRT